MARRRSQNRFAASSASRSVVKNALPSLPVSLFFLGVTLYLGGTMVKLGMQEWTLLKQAQILQGEQQAVAAQYSELNGQIALCRTNEGMERLARQKLGLVKAQEIPIKRAESAPCLPVPSASSESPAVGLPPGMAALVKFFAHN